MNEKHCEHIISFHWQGFEPIIQTYSESSRSIRQLSLESVNLEVSKYKLCVGCIEDDQYTPCPNQVRLYKNTTCTKCNPIGIPIMECVFEPRCNGERCQYPEFCTRPHVVYLALYSNLIKVGMTSEKRYIKRIIEQGADAAATIFNCKNRLEARELEKEISTRFKIPQEIKPQKLMKQWISPPSTIQMKNVYQTYLHKIELWRKPLGNELQIFDEYPINIRPSSPPKIMQTAGMHQGKLLGIKGHFLIYKNQKGTMALNISDMVGRKIRVLSDTIPD